jgi:uncharacterized protein YndB with AHSA1/START domain
MTSVIGTLHRLDDRRGTVRVEDLYETDIDDLWSALTVPERLARWIASVDGDLRVGGRVHAEFTSSWEGPVRIDVCEAPDHLVVTMQPGSDEETLIEAFLSAEGTRTRLVVEERGLPLEVLSLHGAGWHAHLEDLARSLAGQKSEWKSRWDSLAPAYRSLDIA